MEFPLGLRGYEQQFGDKSTTRKSEPGFRPDFEQVADKWKQESRAVAREPRDAAAVVFGLKFADNIHYKFKSR